MHGHRKLLCISTLLHLLFTSILGESLRWRGTTNITFKSRSEASKAQWYILQHLHNVSNEMSLTISPSLCFPWSSPWSFLTMNRINLFECMKLENNSVLCVLVRHNDDKSALLEAPFDFWVMTSLFPLALHQWSSLLQ